MAISLGCTNCEAERESVLQGFNDLLKVLNQAKQQTEVYAKASLYDIINDKSLSKEERRAEQKKFDELLSQQEESDIRMRRTILIGIFSFWELSLKDICEYYRLDLFASHNQKQRNFSENDYLNAIFLINRPENIGVISSQIKELRNYMTHGCAGENRRNAIEKLMVSHPEFCISKINNDYYINSHDGIVSMLDFITDGLLNVEREAKNIISLTKRS